MDVTEVSGESGELALNVEASPIPVDQGSNRKSMPQVVEPRPTAMSFRGGAETDCLRDL